MATEGDFPKSDGDILYASEANTFAIPIGGVVGWFKTMANTPALNARYVECNGQTLSDADSVYNNQTIPDLNGSSGDQRFLRGNTTSDDGDGSSAGGTEEHSHVVNSGTAGSGGNEVGSTSTQNSGTLPSYYECVWVMRIK